MLAILTGLTWNLRILICISLMAENAEFFKKYLLRTYISSFENDHWLTYWWEVLGFGVFNFCSSFYILDIIPLSETTDRKDALPVLGCLFCWQLLLLCNPIYQFLGLFCVLLGLWSSLPWFMCMQRKILLNMDTQFFQHY